MGRLPSRPGSLLHVALFCGDLRGRSSAWFQWPHLISETAERHATLASMSPSLKFYSCLFFCSVCTLLTTISYPLGVYESHTSQSFHGILCFLLLKPQLYYVVRSWQNIRQDIVLYQMDDKRREEQTQVHIDAKFI